MAMETLLLSKRPRELSQVASRRLFSLSNLRAGLEFLFTSCRESFLIDIINKSGREQTIKISLLHALLPR
jgi:hypothetical protein